jgi:putative colanic acid biosynthesis acetyltransferase WcaB
MNFFTFISQDGPANKGNTKGRIVTFCFRVANYAAYKPRWKWLFYPYLAWYKITFEWFIGLELPYDTLVGKGLKIYHLQAIVINKSTVIGEYFTLRQSTTIGNKETGGASPVIGHHVDVGAQVCIIGPIVIGDHVQIGAGSVVVKDLPSGATAVGNPARIVKQALVHE